MKTLFKLFAGLFVLAFILVVAGYFALKRDDIPYETLEARYATPASKFIDLPSGVHLHYRDQGKREGRPLLLVHGYGVSLETWEPWVKQLGDEYRVLSLDLPGHGLTRAPDAYPAHLTAFVDTIEEFAKTLDLKTFALAGNSMGGNIAWMYAAKYPARLDALILIDAGGFFPDSPQEIPLVFQLINNPHLAPLLAQLDPKPLLQNGLKLAYYNDALATDAMATRYAEFARAPGHRQFIGEIERGMSNDSFASKEKLARIKTPTLILWGVKDELIPVGDATRFQEAIAGSTLLLYPDIGHEPHEEAAEKSAADLKAFLSMHPSNATVH